jgi:enediyne biosynthesis protein E4
MRSILEHIVVTILAAFFMVAGAHAQVVFTDITEEAGVALTEWLTESAAWGDYDNDGDEDLYLTVDGPNHLFRNDGGGRFVDVTETAGVGNQGFSVGTAFGDLDNDGDLDLYVVNFGGGLDVLYRNDGPVGPRGAYRFTDITRVAGTNIERSSRGMAFVDYDRDGLLDIFVMAIGPNILYRNLGNLQFRNIAGSLGVDQDDQGVGVVAADINDDGWPDLFTGNRSSDFSNLYVNQGGFFVDVAGGAGITARGLGMGVAAFDVDNDLDMDLYWTSWPAVANALYENRGGVAFENVAVASATDDPIGWGISCNAGDVDLDGWQDFFVTNGFSASSGPNVLFRNLGDGAFADITGALGGGAFDGRGVAFADFDNDGDLDLVVTADMNEPSRLWRNDSPTGHHWLGLRLHGTRSNASAIGARVVVTTVEGSYVQEVSGGAGRGSQNSLPLEFGLGEAVVVEELTIRWPSGTVQTRRNVAVDRYFTITEPVGTIRRIGGRRVP